MPTIYAIIERLEEALRKANLKIKVKNKLINQQKTEIERLTKMLRGDCKYCGNIRFKEICSECKYGDGTIDYWTPKKK